VYFLLFLFGYDKYTYIKYILIGLIDNLCHEVVYHKHKNMNYIDMTNLIIKNIKYLFIEK